MSATEAVAESSSRARQDAEQEPPQRRWVALVSKPIILADGDERVRAMPLGAAVDLDLHDPPKPSYLVLHPRIAALNPGGDVAQQPSAYILAADTSGRLLVRVTSPGSNDPAEKDLVYLCNTHTRGVTPIAAVPYLDLGVDPPPRRSMGLIADTDTFRRGHYLVVQLYPRDAWLPHGADRFLFYSTATLQWYMTVLPTPAAGIMRNPSAETGVLAHAGRIYWLALAYGMFVYDPFAVNGLLRFVPLPADCEMQEENVYREYVAQRRRVAPSEGLLRYVEVRGLSYEVFIAPAVPPPPVNPSVSMWTLVDPDAADWRFEYEVPFAEVWAHESYAAAGLPRGEVPHVALVDPDNHGVVYFLQGSKLFGLDMRARRVVSCEDCPVRDDRDIMLRHSRPIVDAWELSPRPPSPPPTQPPSALFGC